jgi:hypothetical protein
MTMTHQNSSTHETHPAGKAIKDPDHWTTGDEPMTTAQRAYLQTLCDEAQEPLDENLTKAEASKRIEALQQETGGRKRTHESMRTSDTETPGNLIKDPDDWTTGDEPMTGAQRSYLQTLCDEAQEPMDDTLTKAEAAKRIEALQQQTGRGVTAEDRRRPSARASLASASDITPR